MLKVAIDKNPLVSGHKVRGVGRYTLELISSLRRVSYGKAIFKALDFSRVSLDNYDVIHLPFFNPITSQLPSAYLEKTVVTIHDLIPLIYQKVYQPGISGYLNLNKQKKLLSKVAAIIVPSETSKKDVVRFLAVPQEKVHVVYEAQKKIFRKITDSQILQRVRKKYSLTQKFVLYVGDVNYNKNIITLIAACDELAVDLVICGKQALDLDDLGSNLINLRGPRDWLRFLFNKPHPEVSHHGILGDQFRASKSVKRLGFVSDRDLVVLYNLASVYVQPSLYEGFGLSVLEAMACETPTVVAKTNALTEVSGRAALVADPKDAKDFAKKIRTLLVNAKLRKNLLKLGRERVTQFSWEKVAKETIKVYTLVHSKK